MELLHARCAGLDVHTKSVVACARVMHEGKVTQEVETFETTTTGLFRLSDWLTTREVTHVGMEATGVYWKPLWHILEGSFELVLGNAMHIKNVPGRKTDVSNAMWLAARSGPSRSPIPEHPDHRFRAIPITDSGASRSPVPDHPDHLGG